MNRYNLNANLTFVPNDWLEFSNNIKFTHELDDEFGGYRNGYGGIWSTTTWYDLFPFYPNEVDGMPVDIGRGGSGGRSEEHTSELQSRGHLVCRLLLEKKKEIKKDTEAVDCLKSET